MTCTGRRDDALDEPAAMDRALELARRVPVYGPNPRVGCVLLAAPGPGHSGGNSSKVHAPRVVLAEGWHAGAGTAHAEAAALLSARSRGVDLHGATAVVTLEPCNHTGRTGPCAQALLDAGIARVVIAVPDPNPVAAGGAARLRDAGVDVEVDAGPRETEGRELLRTWLAAVERNRPFVTLKLATSLDGRVAARDGSSRWITSEVARRHAHALRADVDAIAVGTGTALADDPSLTARNAAGELVGHQPLRVVLGQRDLPAGARLRGPGGELVHLRTHDVAEILAVLQTREVRHLLVEGGPTVAAAFLRAGVVDEIHAYIAPVLLGAGPPAVGDLGIGSIARALRFVPSEPVPLGPDVLIVATPARDSDRVSTSPTPEASTSTSTSTSEET